MDNRTAVSPIGLYWIIALTSAGNPLNFLVELSEEQERNHGGIEGAAVQGRIELGLLGYDHLQFVGAVPLASEDERRELVEQWEWLDQVEIDMMREDNLRGH